MRRPDEPLVRMIEITSVRRWLPVSAMKERGARNPDANVSASLLFVGTLNEPVRDTREAEITVYSSDDTKIGAGPLLGWDWCIE